jgi:hypothetical protein
VSGTVGAMGEIVGYDALDESAEGVDERVVVVSSNGWWVLVNGDVF